jgi:hypothetical protein
MIFEEKRVDENLEDNTIDEIIPDTRNLELKKINGSIWMTTLKTPINERILIVYATH